MLNVYILDADVMPSKRWMLALPEADRSIASLDAVLVSQAGPRIVWLHIAGTGGLGKLEALRKAHPNDRVVVMSDSPSAAECAQVIKLGARGYCHALATVEMLGEVRTVVEHGVLWVGEDFIHALVRAAGRLLPTSIPEDLSLIMTPREKEVTLALIAGLSNKECARRLGISERTVKAHLSSIFEKCGARDRVQLLVRLSEMTSAKEMPV